MLKIEFKRTILQYEPASTKIETILDIFLMPLSYLYRICISSNMIGPLKSLNSIIITGCLLIVSSCWEKLLLFEKNCSNTPYANPPEAIVRPMNKIQSRTVMNSFLENVIVFDFSFLISTESITGVTGCKYTVYKNTDTYSSYKWNKSLLGVVIYSSSKLTEFRYVRAIWEFV